MSSDKSQGSALAPNWLSVPDDANAIDPTMWPRTAVRRLDGELAIGAMPVSQIAGQAGTPVFVLDEDDFRARARAFKESFDQAFAPFRGARVHYASKAFTSVATVGWLREQGLGLDVCTAGELAVALRGGMPAADIAYHGNNKSDAELDEALAAGIGCIVVDSLDEIERLGALAAARGVVAPVMIRVTTGVHASTHDYIATAHEDQKFGLSLGGGNAFEAARRIVQDYAMSLRLVGLHSHIGSQIFDMSAFGEAASRLVALAAKIDAKLGLSIDELDLGGGYGIAYVAGDDPLTAKEAAGQLATYVAGACDAAGIAVPRVSIEPGRAITGPSQVTVYTVGTVKAVELPEGTRLYVAVDGGMGDNIRPALYGANYTAVVANRASSAAPVLARIVGKHCESGDIVVRDVYVPGDIHAGDLVAVPATGAYGRSMASNYNMIPRPPVVAVRGGALRTVIRRETVGDMLALDVSN